MSGPDRDRDQPAADPVDPVDPVQPVDPVDPVDPVGPAAAGDAPGDEPSGAPAAGVGTVADGTAGDDAGAGREADAEEAAAAEEAAPVEEAAADEAAPVEEAAAEARTPRRRRRERGAGRGVFSRLYHGETSFEFVGRMRLWFLLSGIAILVGAVGLAVNGLNLGIDFRGGNSWTIQADVAVSEVRELLAAEGLPEARVQRFEPVNADPFVRATGRLEGSADEVERRVVEIKERLAERFDAQVGDETVGASWGRQISEKARNALVVFFVVIFLYLFWRFEWRAALAALAAVVHDIFITVGIYALSGFEVSPASVVAFLTILGFSLYDTVVVFDRVDENAKALALTGKHTYSGIVNLSTNQVLMRSLNTSITAGLPILSVLVVGVYLLGATTLRDFGLAMFVGVVVGTYSSIFIAAPILAWLKEREPRYAAIRQRMAQRGLLGTAGTLTPAAAAREGILSPGGRGGRRASAGDEPPDEAVVSAEPAAAAGDDDRAAAGSARSGKASANGGKGKGRPGPAAGRGTVKPRPRKKGGKRR